MSNTPDNNTVSLAQVGFSFDDVQTSLAGVRIDKKVNLMTIPRVVIMEPPAAENKYDDLHQGYGEILDEIQAKMGDRAGELQVVRGDIYKPETLQQLPPMGLLVLENVLSDPYYKGSKDFDSLIGTLSQFMVSGGVILTLDSKLAYFSDEVKHLVQDFLGLVLASGNFTTLLHLIDFEWGIQNIEKRDSQQVGQVIISELDKLNLVDPALVEGLATLRLGIYHCLVLQRV